MGARTARGGVKEHVGSQGMGSDIENRADDVKGVCMLWMLLSVWS